MYTEWAKENKLFISFWKFNKLPNSGISSDWSIIDEVTTRNTTAYFFWPTVYITVLLGMHGCPELQLKWPCVGAHEEHCCVSHCSLVEYNTSTMRCGPPSFQFPHLCSICLEQTVVTPSNGRH